MTDEDFAAEKILAKEQIQREMKKRKQKRQEIAAKNKELERISKVEKGEENEKELWSRLKEANNNFAKMKEEKKKKKAIKRKRFSCNLIFIFVTCMFSWVFLQKFFFYS